MHCGDGLLVFLPLAFPQASIKSTTPPNYPYETPLSSCHTLAALWCMMPLRIFKARDKPSPLILFKHTCPQDISSVQSVSEKPTSVLRLKPLTLSFFHCVCLCISHPSKPRSHSLLLNASETKLFQLLIFFYFCTAFTLSTA